MARYMIGKGTVSALIAGTLALNLLAADTPAPAAPSLNDRLAAVDLQIKDKKFDEALKDLATLEKEQAGNEPDLYKVYRKEMAVADAKADAAAFEAVAAKCLALQKIPVDQRVDLLSVMGSRTDYGSRYSVYHVDLRPEGKVKEMAARSLEYREEAVRLAPSNAGARVALGDVYLERGEADKAGAQYTGALALSNLPPMVMGSALIGQASVALLKKDRAGAIKICEDLAARKLATGGRWSIDPTGQARMALGFLQDVPELDGMRLPWYTGAKVFPAAQQAKYSEEFVPLKAVKLVLGKGMKMDDLRVQFLKIKFDRFGIKIDDSASFAIRINAEAEPKAPEKAEGYAIRVTKDGACLNSRDALGTTWSVVSLIQLFDLEKPGEPKLRLCEVSDYPDMNYRGCIAGFPLEAALFSKMNVIISGGLQLTLNDVSHPTTPLMREVSRRRTEAFDAFGLRLYYDLPQYTMYPRLPLSSERTFALHLKLFNEIADGRGHVYFPYDDGRFPVPKADLDAYGSAANTDAKYLTRLYKEVKKSHPDFHFIFCPPFYWGPDSDASYPEPREPYLKSLGEFLDPEIKVFWTGPRVKGYQKTPEQVKWFTDLTKHKPVIFQNGTGRHNLWSYLTDEMPEWKTWHYDGFADKDLTGFLKNGGEIPQVITLGDYLWNIKGYDSAASIRNAVAMFYGKDMFNIMDPATKAMTKLDKYPYMEIRPGAAEEADEIAKLSLEANAALDKALAYNAYAINGWGGHLISVIKGSKKLAELAKTAPDLKKMYGRQVEATRELAAKETGIDAAKGDIFKSPIDLVGGELLEYEWKMIPKRFAVCIRGKLSGIPTVTTSFECDPFPPSGPYELNLSGLDDDPEKGAAIRISVNGKAIFEGASTFARDRWSVQKFVIPFETLKRNNVLLIECTDDGNPRRSGPPWFMVNYLVLKKTAQ